MLFQQNIYFIIDRDTKNNLMHACATCTRAS